MIRFFIIWIVFSSLIGGFVYLASKKEKKQIKNIGWKVSVSAGAGLLVASSLMALNHVQGL
jgi:hypothetical protein